jgi:mono/diheme cytochrome c family protein
LSAGCTALDNALAAVPIFAFLRESPFFDPYEAPRPAPLNSVPLLSPNGPWEPAVQPTEASLQAFAASEYGRNPYANDTTLSALGMAMYDRHCMVCHAANGQGTGPVVGPGKFPLAPTLVGATAPGRSDGYIYAVIKAGRTLMPPYGSRTTHLERWAIVNYVRQLQRAAGAQPAAQPAQPGAPQDTAR